MVILSPSYKLRVYEMGFEKQNDNLLDNILSINSIIIMMKYRLIPRTYLVTPCL